MKRSIVHSLLKLCSRYFLKSVALTTFLFFCLESFSQVSFGLKSGVNVATTKGYSANPKNKPGWHAGGFVKIAIGEKLFLQQELIYSTKGQRTKYVPGGDSKQILIQK
jgi:hypothetical protein